LKLKLLASILLSTLLSACQKEETDSVCKESDVFVTVYQDEDYGRLGQVFGIGEYLVADLTVAGSVPIVLLARRDKAQHLGNKRQEIKS
jgi:hypothetical protein